MTDERSPVWYGTCGHWTADWSKLRVPGIPTCPLDGAPGFHACDCTNPGCCEDCPRDERCGHNVGAFPYYGPDTYFYGEDVAGGETL